MRVLVSGSRHFSDSRLLAEVLDRVGREQGPITEVIEGEARGADTLARLWAERRGIEVHKFPADWTAHGKAAGHIRNKQMLDEGKPDLVIAFLAPNSRGTANMISQTEKAGVPVKVIDIA